MWRYKTILSVDWFNSYIMQSRAAVSLSGSYPEGRWFESTLCTQYRYRNLLPFILYRYPFCLQNESGCHWACKLSYGMGQIASWCYRWLNPKRWGCYPDRDSRTVRTEVLFIWFREIAKRLKAVVRKTVNVSLNTTRRFESSSLYYIAENKRGLHDILE